MADFALTAPVAKSRKSLPASLSSRSGLPGGTIANPSRPDKRAGMTGRTAGRMTVALGGFGLAMAPASLAEDGNARAIWISDPDGQNAVPLTDDPGTEDQPAWSPDGRQIVYAAFPKEGGSFDLWLMYADGSGRRRLTTTPANEIFPAWHPSGETIAYVTDVNGNFDIYSIDVRDGRTAPLVVSPEHEARPAWSRDGTKLAFTRC